MNTENIERRNCERTSHYFFGSLKSNFTFPCIRIFRRYQCGDCKYAKKHSSGLLSKMHGLIPITPIKINKFTLQQSAIDQSGTVGATVTINKGAVTTETL